MLQFYSPSTSPNNAKLFSPVVHFTELLAVYGNKKCYQIHHRLPPDPTRITHFVLRARTPYHLLKESTPLSIFDHLGNAEVEMLRSGRWKLLLDLGWEMFYPRANIIEPFHRALAEYQIRPKTVFILNSNLSSEEVYEATVEDHHSRVHVLPFSVGGFIFLSHHFESNAASFQSFVDREQSMRPNAVNRRIFLNFNGRIRPHRSYLVAFLLAKGLISKGFVSLLGYDRATDGSKLKDCRDIDASVRELRSLTARWPHFETVSPAFRELFKSLPLELDLSAEESVKNSRYKTITPWEIQDMDLYRRSYFSIVADSSFTGQGLRFITEKVFKPLICFHPFVYIGHERALKELRRLGFLTFEPFFNETYDEEPNPYARFGMALNEIERLCALPGPQAHAIFEKLWPRLVHNARLGRLSGLKLGRLEFHRRVIERI